MAADMHASGYVKVGKVAQFENRICRVINLNGRAIAVWRDGDKFYAFRNSCPHHGAPLNYGVVSGTMLPSRPGELDYGLEGLVLRCPWHGYEFSLEDGRMLFGTGAKRVVRYQVMSDGDDLYLRVKGE